MQKVQIGIVRKFVDNQIDSEIQRVKIKKSLEILQKELNKQNLSLKEVVDRHTAELLVAANQSGVELDPKLGKNGELGRVRFENKSAGFDFVRILQCTASLRPLIYFQRKLKDRSKRRHVKHLADIAARRLKGEEELGDEESEA